jgi:riboflavin kinase/FMN adenylyltransferase
MTLLRNIKEFPESFRGGAVAIGNFDGVHLGHARLIERLRAMAKEVGGPAVAFTFDPSPTRILRPDAAPESLVWLQRKVEILSELGADAVFVVPTDRALLELEAREFFDRFVLDLIAARAMVEGPNFFFGHNRSGNVEVLRQFCKEANIPFELAEPLEIDGKIVSSSRIRLLVMEGRLDEARAMLGRPYRIRGEVIRGAGRGAKIGYPTANIGRIDTLLPGEGIYAARALVGSRHTPCAETADRTRSVPATADGTRSVPATDSWHPAAVSVGPNPTFDEAELKVEAYIIGFQGDIYGQPIAVDFLARLRDIKRFDSTDALVAQMARDVERVIENSNISVGENYGRRSRE